MGVFDRVVYDDLVTHPQRTLLGQFSPSSKELFLNDNLSGLGGRKPREHASEADKVYYEALCEVWSWHFDNWQKRTQTGIPFVNIYAQNAEALEVVKPEDTGKVPEVSDDGEETKASEETPAVTEATEQEYPTTLGGRLKKIFLNAGTLITILVGAGAGAAYFFVRKKSEK